jgi:hypothetical protein
MEKIKDLIAEFVGLDLYWKKGVVNVSSRIGGVSLFNPAASINGLYLDLNELLYIIRLIGEVYGEKPMCDMLRKFVFDGKRTDARGLIYDFLANKKVQLKESAKQ